MAKGRKSQYVSKLTSKDQNMLHAFRCAGYLREDHLKTELKQADRRIKGFCRDGYIEKVAFFNRHTHEFENVYRLTEKGQKLATDTMGLKHYYRSNSIRHDLSLAKQYFSLSEGERASWITEGEFRKMLEYKIEELRDRNPQEAKALQERLEKHQLSPTDGGYVNSNGQTVCLEIITNNYGEMEKAAKESFCETLQFKYESTGI